MHVREHDHVQAGRLLGWVRGGESEGDIAVPVVGDWSAHGEDQEEDHEIRDDDEGQRDVAGDDDGSERPEDADVHHDDGALDHSKRDDVESLGHVYCGNEDC